MNSIRTTAPGLVLTVASAVVLITASGSALAQRSLSNTNSGGGGSRTVVQTNAGPSVCNLSNTSSGALGEGFADACRGFVSGPESSAEVGALVSAYGVSGGVNYTLALSAAGADRWLAGGTNSSAGLFKAFSFTPQSLSITFLREEIGDFVFAFSGIYNNASTSGLDVAWSSYYLYDNVLTNFTIPSAPLATPSLDFSSCANYRQPNPFGGRDRLFADCTNGLVIQQMSVYKLDRVPNATAVPEPATWALTGLALLAGLGLSRRARRRI